MTLRRLLFPLALAGALVAGAGEAAAAVRALVVGVDRYVHIPPLEGAVGDARDLTRALRSAGAEVTALTDRAVSRRAILDTWAALARASGPDDVLVLTFAGHGIQVPDEAGDEADGFDEAFVMPGFAVGEADDANLLRDDQIDEMIRLAAPTPVVLVADTCHSGSFARARDDRITGLRSRFVPRSTYGGFDDMPFPTAPSKTAPSKTAPSIEAPAGNLAFFGAVPEMLVVHEVIIGGEPRGALSYAFARAIEGQADTNGDGVVRLSELRAQVPEMVRTITQTRQTPQIVSRLTRDLSLSAAAGSTNGTITPVWPPLRLALDGPGAATGRALIRRLDGVETSAAPDQAELIWHLPSGDVLTAFGDVAARLGPARDPSLLQGIVNKWRLLGALDQRIDGMLTARVRPDDGLYRADERLTVEVEARRDGRFLLFDLASDGTVLQIAPRLGEPPVRLVPGERQEIALRVGPPYGADHLVAVVTGGSGSAAGRLVTEAHGRPLDDAAMRSLAQALESAHVLPISIYTAP